MGERFRALRAAIARVTYKPGWELELVEDIPHMTMTLVCRMKLPDSRFVPAPGTPHYAVPLAFRDTVPWQMVSDDGVIDVEYFRHFIRMFFRNFENHEVDEWLQVDGYRLNDPHAKRDPVHLNFPVGSITAKLLP